MVTIIHRQQSSLSRFQHRSTVQLKPGNRMDIRCYRNRIDISTVINISCMNFNAMPVTGALEADLQVPVVSSNAATLWKILQTIGVEESIAGCGRLLSDYVSSQSGE